MIILQYFRCYRQLHKCHLIIKAGPISKKHAPFASIYSSRLPLQSTGHTSSSKITSGISSTYIATLPLHTQDLWIRNRTTLKVMVQNNKVSSLKRQCSW